MSGPTLYCPQCGYNLTGLTGRRCPECGRAYDPAVLRQAQINAEVEAGTVLIQILFFPMLFAAVAPCTAFAFVGVLDGIGLPVQRYYFLVAVVLFLVLPVLHGTYAGRCYARPLVYKAGSQNRPVGHLLWMYSIAYAMAEVVLMLLYFSLGWLMISHTVT